MLLNRNNRVNEQDLFVDEAIFTNQNRWLGVRNNFEEHVPYHATMRGTYINGFYDTHFIEYGERAYGFPDLAQTIVNVPDAQTIYFQIDQKTLNLSNAKIIDLKRTYDLEKGHTKRVVVYELESYGLFTLTFTRHTHLTYKNLFINEVCIESENYEGDVLIVSTLNGNTENYVSKSDPRVPHKHQKKLTDPSITLEKDHGYMTLSTRHSQIGLIAGITHNEAFDYAHEHGEIVATKAIRLSKNKPYRFIKYAVYHTTLEQHNLLALYTQSIKRIQSTDYNKLIKSHIDALSEFNTVSKICIDSSEASINETIAYNLYQLYTAGAANENVNIPAKGLTGEGYEGHTFWDTEIYLVPYFMQIDPQLAKRLLIHRYKQLPNARKEAETLGVPEGVKFAWRTINGDETSPYYPAGTAQYHINSDIAYTVIKYYELTQDQTFMNDYGFEIILETARFFKHVVHKSNGKYHLHHVTGPDEYTAVVDNNYYTNRLLKYHLDFLINYTESNKINLDQNEVKLFKDIRDHIVLLHDKTLNIDVQDQSFLSKKPWDLNRTPKHHFPLLLTQHPLTIYRHQVLKQPDTVLSHVLLNDRPLSIQKDSFEYYEKLTTHDSSLSYCIHALQAARLNQLDKSYDYFMNVLALDIDNIQGNTQYGLHLANLGGVYLAILKGFVGYECDAYGVKIDPRIPKAWQSLKMIIRVDLTTLIELIVKQDSVTCKASNDANITIQDQHVTLKKDLPKEIKLRY